MFTISGTPTAAGNTTYTITLTGGCGNITATGTINVTANNTITLTSAAGTNVQTKCINTAITNITYSTTGASSGSASGLPTGVTGTWSANVFTISGTPTTSGTFNYTVTLSGGCGAITASGTITVNPLNTITLSSGVGTNAQTLCINTAITPITYATTGATGGSATSLPTGVTGAWSANVFTISGTPTTSGTFNYTVTLTGGCGVITATGSITVTANNTITLSSAAGTNAQTKCINTAITNITYNTIGAIGATITGLPAGVTGSWAGNVFTITGTPTASGNSTYTITLTGGCGNITTTGTINVTAANTITLSSAAGTNAQTKCINTALTNITYATTGATGGSATGLPVGVTGTWAANVFTISGTPTAAGTFNYTVTLNGGCGVITATGSITVTANNTIVLSSAAGTNTQTLCINTAITPITYNTTGATGGTIAGLPAGVTGSWAGNVFTISGTPTAAGNTTYTITLTGGCGNITATGTINVTADNIITLTSAVGTNAQTKCINTAITNITYSTVRATGATVTGLPTGVTGAWAANVVTISGTPTLSGTFNYTVTLTGGCGAITASGTITINPLNTITLTSAAGTNTQTKCVNQAITNITYSTTGATGGTIAGLPAGVTGSWAGNVYTITGTPTASGTFNYTVTLTGGCGTVTATGSIIVNTNNSITTQPPASIFLCPNGTLTISVVASGTNTFQWKKNGVNIVGATATSYTKANVVAADSGTYTVTVTNGCGIITSQNCVVKIVNGVSVSIVADYCATPGRIKLTAVVIPNTAVTGFTYNWSNGGTRDTTYVNIAGTYSVTVTPTAATSTSTGCLGTATASLAVSQELAANGNFNLGNVGFTCPPLFGAAYQYFVDSPNYQRELTVSGRYGIGTNANNYNTAFQGKDHTTRTGNFMIVRGYSFLKPMVWQDTVSVTPNTTYYFTGWAMGIDSSAITNIPILRFAVNGNLVGNPLILPPHGLSPNSPDFWLRFYTTWNSGSATTAVFSIYDSTATFRGNAFGLDDISIGPLSTFISLTSSAATDTQTVCINSPIQPVTLVLGSGGAPVVTGLPPGVSYTFNGSALVITGSPTTSGTFNYTVATTGCSVKTFYGQIKSQSQNITLTSAAGTNNQSFCIGNPLIAITYSIIGNALPSVSGLPNGVTYTYLAGIVNINGTPTQAGTFTYTINATGGTCTGLSSVTGIITVNALPVFTITVDSCMIAGRLVLEAVPQNPGTYTYLWNTGSTTDTLSVGVSGNYNVIVTNANGCQSTQNINISIGLVQTSPAATSTQNACLNTAITNITYSAGGNLITYSATGLPPGVTASYNAGIITISGTPTQLGTFNYTLNFTGSLCRLDLPVTYTKTGTITVNTNPTVTIAADFCAINNKVRLTATPAPVGTYTYLWSSGSTADTAQVFTAGNFTVTVTNTVGCKATASYLVNTEISINGNFNAGNTGFLSDYIFVTDSVNFQDELTPPGLYGVDTNANNYNVDFWGHDHTTGSGKFMIIHGIPFQEPIAWQQTLAVEPNTTYYFTGWGMGLDSTGNNASLQFSVNGNQIGNDLNLTDHGQSPTAPNNWRRFYSTWDSNNNTSATFSISNTPSGFFGNGYGLDDISIGKITPYLNLTSNPSTDTQFVCINTAIQPVTLSYGSGGTPTVTGLPAGVTMSVTNTTITISGTPTVAGTFNYTISTAGCSIKRFFGQIITQSTNLLLTSAAATNNQAVCINSPITNITYTAVPTVTGLTITGLPTGVSYVFSAGVLTISGTPTLSGVFNYTVTITGGGCSATNTYTGTINAKARPVVTITVDYCTAGKALLKAIPSPAGTHTFSWSNGRTTDTTTVTTSGTYTVTVTNSLGCQTVATVNVTIGILLTSAATTNNQNVCLGDTVRRITYATAGNITAVSVTGLPTGVNYNFSSSTITISGTPTLIGTYNYTITSTVSCGTAPTATGTIRVNAKPAVTIKANYCAVPGKVRLKAFVTPAGTYTYLWSNGATTDTTSVNAAGTYSVTVTNASGCSMTASMPVSIELVTNGNFNAGNTGFNTPPFLGQQYQYIADSPNVQTELAVPGFYGIGPNANNYNNSYQGHDHTSGNGNFMIVHGVPFVQVVAWEKTINVTPNTTYYFSAWAQGLDSLNNNPILKFTVNGNQVGTNLALTNHGQSATSPDNWARFYSTWNSGTATLASFAITDVQTFSLGNSFGLDDISIGTMAPFITLVSPASTDTQTVCLNTPIDAVILCLGADSIPPVVTGLPPGVTYTFDGYKLIITGTPSTLGVFNYTVSISGCVSKTFYGQITAQGQALVLTSSTNSNNQSACIGNPIVNIVYNTGGNINSSAISVTGLPPGVTYTVANGSIIISGTPTQIGTFNYTITVTGGICSTTSTTVTASGTINATAIPTITILSDYCTIPGKVKLKAVPNPAGAYTYYWNNGATTDTTTVDLVGTFTVTITNSSGCRATASIAVSTELVANGNFNLGNTGFITTPSGTQRYVYVPDSANYRRELYNPGRYGIGPNANNYHDLYWGHDHTTGTGNFMIVHGYAFSAPILWQDTVQVTPNTNYYFSAWGMSLNSLGFNGRLKFSINSAQVGNILNLPNRGNSDTSADNWTRFYTTWNSGTATSAVLSITNTQTSFIGNSFGIDDVSFASMSPFINLVSSPSTDTQTVCINNPIVPVSLTVGSGGNVVVTGLPTGVTYTFNGYNLLISGSPTVLGTFNYTISLSSNCAPRTFNGQIISRGQTLTLTSAPATTNQTICLRSPITNIVIQSAGNITNVSATGLPTGLNAAFNAGIFTISGTPTQSGVFNYTVSTSGPFCAAATISGVLTVNASPTAAIATNPSTVVSCSSLSVTLTASGGTIYNWNGGLGSTPSITVSNAGNYAVVVTNALGCKDSTSVNITNTIPPNISTWLGINTNWNDASNWCGGIPTSSKNVLIPSTVTNYPVINANTNAICLDMTVNSGATLTINNSGILTAIGNFNNNGSLNNNGKIVLSGIANQTFPGPGLITAMDTLQINNTSGVTLNKSITIQKELKPTAGIISLGNFDITLKSDATATASVSAIGNNAGFTYGSGRFVVERYVPTGTGAGQHGKSWQFIAAPVQGAQTIKEAWQENALFPNQNPNPGYGTQITGEFTNAISLGFDVRTNAPSMKVYDTATNSFIGVLNTISYPIQNNKGYMIFIRGNRNDTSFTQASEPTTLRERGTIYARGNDAPPVIAVPAGGYQSIGNPYPSTIDFSNNTGVVFNRGTAIDNAFYVWDPTLSGSYNLGGYQTISATNNWVPVPGGTTSYPAAVSNPKIQSGQAFFMHATGSGGTVTFNEAAKISGSNLVTRNTASANSTASSTQFFESKLYNFNNGVLKLADGNLLAFSSDYANDIDANDATKLNNTSENFGLSRRNKILAIEARQPLTINDTIYYSSANLKIGNYRINFLPTNLSSAGLVPYLIDNFLQTSSLLSLNDTTHYDFSVSSNIASASNSRFIIVFTPALTLPVNFTNVFAVRKTDTNILINWSIEQEADVINYEIERSTDCRNFVSIQHVNPLLNNGSNVNYQYIDTTDSKENLFYRIKANKRDASFILSNIVKVNGISSIAKIEIFPNPVPQRTLFIKSDGFKVGKYQVEIYSTNGQFLFSNELTFSQNQQLNRIEIPKKIPAGSYVLKIKQMNSVYFSKEIIVE